MKPLRCAFVIDIGGTAIKAALIREDGVRLVTQRIPTPPQAAPEHIARHILTLMQDVCAQQPLAPADLAGVGVSIAAFITHDGLVTATAHLSREWVGYHLGERLRETCSVPLYFALDTPAPTLGEAYYGAGRGSAHFAYVTISTGIGAGLMANGQYVVGGLGWAGGVGHIIIDETSERVCSGCGNRGCLETFAATQGILATAHEMRSVYPHSPLCEGDITAQQLAQAADAGDPLARAVWERVGHTLGIGLTALVNITSPSRLVIGGGIAQAGEWLLAPARHVIQSRAFPPRHRDVEVVQAALGDLSGIYGCAAMVFHDLRINPALETRA